MTGEPWLNAVRLLNGDAEDTYEWFTRLGFRVLRPNGAIGFVTADTFFTLESFGGMRELLQSRALDWIGQCVPFDATVDAAGARNNSERVSEDELSAAIVKRRHGEAWELILPEVTQLRLSTDGSGVPISMRISKDAPAAVRIAKPGEEVVGTLLKQEVNVWDKFNMSRDMVAEKLGLSGPRTHALIYELAIQDDDECYSALKRGSQIFKGYSLKALDRLREAKKTLDMDKVWQRQKHRFGAGARKK